jgi:hypothetical protein
MSFLLQVFFNDNVSVVKHAVFPGCSSLTAITYSSLADVQKFITLIPFIRPGSLNNRWKAEKLLYVFLFLAVRTLKLENCVDCMVQTEFTVVFHYC